MDGVRNSGRALRLSRDGRESLGRALIGVMVFVAASWFYFVATRPTRADGPPSSKFDPASMLDLPVHPSNRYTPPPAPPTPSAPPAVPTPPPPPVTTDAPLPPPPPVAVYGLTLDPKRNELVLILDISSSMALDQQTFTTSDGATAVGPRLARAKAQLVRCLRAMAAQEPGVRWQANILAYDCNVRWALQEYGNSSVSMMPVKANLERFESWVTKLEPGGGTGTGPAVYEAAWYVPKSCKQLVLITDGAPCCGEFEAPGDPPTLRRHLSMIEDAQKLRTERGGGRFRIDVVGVGATGVFKQFCLDVAARGAGTFVEVK